MIQLQGRRTNILQYQPHLPCWIAPNRVSAYWAQLLSLFCSSNFIKVSDETGGIMTNITFLHAYIN